MSPILSSHPRPRQLVTSGSNIGEAHPKAVTASLYKPKTIYTENVTAPFELLRSRMLPLAV
jgi:hypothetical protein